MLDEKGAEIHVPGVLRCRALVGSGPYDVVDLRVGMGRKCKGCTLILQRPVRYVRGDHHDARCPQYADMAPRWKRPASGRYYVI